MHIPTKNVQRSFTINRYLYAVLKEVAEKTGTSITHLINQELSILFEDNINQLKLKEEKAEFLRLQQKHATN